MTKNETLTILALLNAFYAGGKNDPKQQAEAWHMILHKYDYESARMAVLNFAENDTRDYATFPAVGLIVNEIRKAEKSKGDAISQIIIGISYGRTYDMIPDKAKALISESTYNEWLAMDAELFSIKAGTFKEMLQQKQKRIGVK
jgi:hypothetical protein